MKNIIFHLKKCNTCQRIIGELGDVSKFEIQNIKEENISAEELDFAKDKIGSYESLFNKRARKYRSTGLNEKDLTEQEWKKHILSEYTYLKRPMVFFKDKVYAGNSKKTIEELKSNL